MWNEAMPKWRTAHKQHQCQGEDCGKVILIGERYLDKVLSDPEHTHQRYCQECAGPVMAKAKSYHYFNGRNDFRDRYNDRISSTEWKNLRQTIIEQRGTRCQRCGAESGPLALHHLHYRSLGNEQPQDVELLCPECHEAARPPKREYPKEGLIAGPGGSQWGEFAPNTVYLPSTLSDGTVLHIPVEWTPPLDAEAAMEASRHAHAPTKALRNERRERRNEVLHNPTLHTAEISLIGRLAQNS
ncbi:HNH endonuclease [Nordella sp. HKS 07]|uniref:HNH endonuclease n=1 Tax=Nordella sp. HKS 07 TaxID=2712222 RepID=UPI0013E14995|nr:HNH endonuclease [Nordella sp. HKS 07]QIG50423.1 HNH endonuclease [Nordella sp. HKS 07]